MRLIEKIRARETPLYDRIYRAGKAARRWEVPYYAPFWRALSVERALRHTTWRNFKRIFYYEPLFRSQLVKAGRGLWVDGTDLPLVMGNPQIEVGSNFRVFPPVTITAHKNAPNPRLVFGDDCALGNRVVIAIGSEIICGDRVWISAGTYIAGYSGHRLDPRLRHEDVPDEVPSGIRIGDDVWIASGCFIRGGVTIGEAAVIASHSVITKDVPPGVLVGGNPARVIRGSVYEGSERDVERD